MIEMQSSARDGTVTANAVANGYAEEDVEERTVTQAEFNVIFAAQIERENPDRAKVAQETEAAILEITGVGISRKTAERLIK